MTTEATPVPQRRRSVLWSRRIAADPPVVVRRLAPEVLEHFGVREDQERLGVEARDDRVGDRVGFEHAVDARDAAVVDARGHRGAHGLRREHRHLDPRSPYVIASHSANANAACFVTEYGALPIWVSSPAADAVCRR